MHYGCNGSAILMQYQCNIDAMFDGILMQYQCNGHAIVMQYWCSIDAQNAIKMKYYCKFDALWIQW